MTSQRWKALDLMVYEIQAEYGMEPMGLMGIDLMRRVALERRDKAERLLQLVERIERAFDNALQTGDVLGRKGAG